MEIFFKAVSGVFIAIILIQALSQNEKNIALLLSILVCCMVFTAIVSVFKPIISFFERLNNLIYLNSDMLSIIFKILGIGYLSEIASNLCQDIGNSAMSKVIQILSLVSIMALAIPIFDELLILIENVLSNL